MAMKERERETDRGVWALQTPLSPDKRSCSLVSDAQEPRHASLPLTTALSAVTQQTPYWAKARQWEPSTIPRDVLIASVRARKKPDAAVEAGVEKTGQGRRLFGNDPAESVSSSNQTRGGWLRRSGAPGAVLTQNRTTHIEAGWAEEEGEQEEENEEKENHIRQMLLRSKTAGR
ncbi:unnamed protein product [Pleuronectes platessa]|uniref:Uncharacterized protein n=1 Tax=Pleuronectes platessa TaxID=8262 RepID=A0A9N7ZCT2_PLEPL|nr:unnamed protein product [Pleuronectes platessa]